MENIETIDDIIKKRFFIQSDYLSVDYPNVKRGEENDWIVFSHITICSLFQNTDYELLWLCYWNHINKKGYSLISDYLGTKIYNNPKGFQAFLRLLILEDFKKFCEIKA